MFCPECGSMMFPIDGKYTCKSCSKTMDIIGEAKVYKSKSKDTEMSVISNDDATLPKTHILCPQCQHTEAYFVIRQTRAADEPETRIYRCCKCNYNWREY